MKLDANESPFALGAALRGELAAEFARALADVELHRYPDPTARDLRALLARDLGVAADRILVANGSDEAIQMLLMAAAGPGAGREVQVQDGRTSDMVFGVADLVAFLAWLGLGAQSEQEGRSFLSGRMGERITGAGVTLVDDAFGVGHERRDELEQFAGVDGVLEQSEHGDARDDEVDAGIELQNADHGGGLLWSWPLDGERGKGRRAAPGLAPW